MADYTGKQLRRAHLAACLAEHASHVEVFDDDDHISDYFRWIGWQWYLDEYFDGGEYDEQTRRDTGRGNYCGVGPAAMGVATLGYHVERMQCVPVSLDPGIANYVLPSTERIDSEESWAEAGFERPEFLDADQARPGDIVTVRTRDTNPEPFGDHVVVVRDHIHSGKLPTVEFNAAGRLGDGSWGRGVVKRSRSLTDVRRVLRLERKHFNASFQPTM